MNNTIIITKYRRPFHNLKDFTDIKINLKNFKILVVKSGYLSPDLKKLKAKSYMLLTNGCVNQDITKIENTKRIKPLFPFENPKKMKF